MRKPQEEHPSSSLSFIISSQLRITAACVLGLQPGARGENTSPMSGLLRCVIWILVFGDDNMQMSCSGGGVQKRQSCQPAQSDVPCFYSYRKCNYQRVTLCRFHCNLR